MGGMYAQQMWGLKRICVNPAFNPRQHYQNVIHFHGEHRLNRQVIEEVLVPLVKEITNE